MHSVGLLLSIILSSSTASLPSFKYSADENSDHYTSDPTTIVTNNKYIIEYYCQHNRPIEIIWNFDPKRGDVEVELARAYRSIKYIVWYKLFWKNVKQKFEIVCQEVGKSNSRVYIQHVKNSSAPNTTTIQVVKLNDELTQASSITKAEEKCAIKFYFQFNFVQGRLGVKCETKTGDLASVYSYNLLYPGNRDTKTLTGILLDNVYRSVQLESDCVERIPTTEECKDCKILKNPRYTKGPTAIHCSIGNLTRVQRFFYGLQTGKDLSFEEPNVYFNWYDVNPQEMIHLQVSSENVPLNGKIKLICYQYRMYFALVSSVALEKANGSLEYIKLDDNDGPGDDDDWFSRTITQNIFITDITTVRVYCFGPVSNSSEWINASAPINIHGLEAAQFISNLTIEEIEVGSSGVNHLDCSVKGYPIPEITWESPSGAYKHYSISLNDDGQKSSLIFSTVEENISGNYTCIAKNHLSTVRKTFVVKVVEKSILLPILVITLGLGIVSSLLIVLVFLYKKNLKQSTLLEQEKEEVINEFIQGLKVTAVDNVYYNSDILSEAYTSKFEVPLNKWMIDYDNKLGEGEFGLVFGGKVTKDDLCYEIAVKMMKPKGSAADLKCFLSELKILSSISTHENVVSLVAAFTGNIKKGQIFIGMEMCSNGSLYNHLNFLRKTQAVSVENETLIQDLNNWSGQIVQGLIFLSSQNVIHGDLATRNILLTANYKVKLTDFGLSRQVEHYAVYNKKSKCPLPLKWMAVESLQFMKFSLMSDTWAAGVVLWEIYSLGMKPFPDIGLGADFVHQISHGLRLQKPLLASEEIYCLMQQCWDAEPSRRPLIKSLENFFSKK